MMLYQIAKNTIWAITIKALIGVLECAADLRTSYSLMRNAGVPIQIDHEKQHHLHLGTN